MKRLETAYRFHHFGFNLIPTKADKRPAVQTWDAWKGTRQSTDDLEALEWERSEVAGLAAISGSVSGDLAAVDIDGGTERDCLEEALEHLGLPEDYKWIVRTPGRGGGWHIWLRSPGLEDALKSAGIKPVAKLVTDWLGADHLELRWKDCYTLLPPSRHPDGRYDFVGKTIPTEPPCEVDAARLVGMAEWKREMQCEQPSAAVGMGRYVERALEEEAALLAATQAGHRNDQLNTAAFKLATMAHAGADRGQVEQVLSSAALAAGLTAQEIKATFASGWNDGLGHPRIMPERETTRVTVGVEQKPSHDRVTLAEALEWVRTHTLDPLPPGIEYPWPTVNRCTRGMHPGWLCYLAGYTSHGKTAAAIEIALATAMRDKRVLFISGEMSGNELAVRVAQRFGLSSRRFYGSAPGHYDIQAANSAIADESHRLVAIQYTRQMPVIEEAVADYQPDLVIVDYLQYLDIGKSSRLEGTTKNSQALKDIARRHNIPVLCLSQLRRPDRQMRENAPWLDDLRDSGSIEQDADQVVFVWRERMEKDQSGRPIHCGKFIVAKARMGELAKVKYRFHALQQMFFDDGPED